VIEITKAPFAPSRTGGIARLQREMGKNSDTKEIKVLEQKLSAGYRVLAEPMGVLPH
jgi:hypothetical protein